MFREHAYTDSQLAIEPVDQWSKCYGVANVTYSNYTSLPLVEAWRDNYI